MNKKIAISVSFLGLIAAVIWIMDYRKGAIANKVYVECGKYALQSPNLDLVDTIKKCMLDNNVQPKDSKLFTEMLNANQKEDDVSRAFRQMDEARYKAISDMQKMEEEAKAQVEAEMKKGSDALPATPQ